MYIFTQRLTNPQKSSLDGLANSGGDSGNSVIDRSLNSFDDRFNNRLNNFDDGGHNSVNDSAKKTTFAL